VISFIKDFASFHVEVCSRTLCIMSGSAHAEFLRKGAVFSSELPSYDWVVVGQHVMFQSVPAECYNVAVSLAC
jgi:hypothetical protein